MPTRDEYLSTLHRDLELFDAAIRAGGDLSQPVDGCGEWTLADLAAHLGGLEHYVAAGIAKGASPDAFPAPPADVAAYADWCAQGAAAIEAALTASPDDTPCWTFFPNAPQEIGTWVRRMTQEHAVHRYDAELAATGTAEAIDPIIARDGIDEFLDLFLARVDKRRPIRIGDLAVQLQSLDGDGDDGAWMVRCGDGPPVVTREHFRGDVALQGSANSVLLALWGRVEPGEMDLEIYGSPDDWARFRAAIAI
ncbi:MAG: hypothetical protein QOJ00_2260 [Actinomycetota bacterium]